MFIHINNVDIDQSWDLMKIVSNKCPRTWFRIFMNAKDELEDIADILEESGPYFPMKKDLFRAFYLTPLPSVKVVLVGQDPYHDTIYNGEPKATGLSFSTHPLASVSPSLKNIYKEIKRSCPEFIIPNHGDLTKWAEQGVLMLNSCLTVKPHEPGSHGRIWHGFIDEIIKAVCNTNPDCIFLLWGKPAQKLREMIKGNAVILACGHPSPLNRNSDFNGCNHFAIVNETLIKQGRTPIDWQV